MDSSDVTTATASTAASIPISFVETEPNEQSFFASELPDHPLEFVRSLTEVSEEAEIVSVFIYSKITADFFDAHPHVRLIVTRSTTTEHIDLDACTQRGVAVASIASYGENTVAEHAFALLLAVARRLGEVMASHRKGNFSFEALRSIELYGKTLGLIGAGRIGQRVIPIARAFGMSVLVEDPSWSHPLASSAGAELVSFEEALVRSDFLSLHASLTPETYHLINRETLSRCRPGVIIINTARGGLIETDALIEALDSGHVAGVGLDVLEEERVMRTDATRIMGAEIVERLRSGARFAAQESRDPHRIHQLMRLMRSESLLERPNVVFTPHVAFNSVEAIERIGHETVSVIHAYHRASRTRAQGVSKTAAASSRPDHSAGFPDERSQVALLDEAPSQ